MEISPSIISMLNVTCCIDMQVKINKYILKKTGLQSFIIWLPHDTDVAIIQVIGEKILDEALQFSIPPAAEFEKSLTDKASFVVDDELKRLLHLHLDPFPEKLSKYSIFSSDSAKRISLLVCICSCSDATKYEAIIAPLFRIITGPLLSALNLRRERQRKEQSQELLSIAKDLFMHLGDLVDLMQEIIMKARNLTNAERCSLFLLSDNGTELVAKILDGLPRDAAEEIRVPISKSIAGHVATTGKTLNIHDAYSHPLFYRKFDETTGFKTRNILCFPIRDSKEHIVGVAQLCNKKNGPFFTILDEEAAAALATYCGISLMHSLVYKKIQLSQARIRLANELLMYHMAVSEESVAEVTQYQGQEDIASLLNWRWPCRYVRSEETPSHVLRMYETLGFVKTFRMDRSTLARFILMVRKGYRELPYHNWLHAFSVAHFIFYVLKELDLIGKSLITELEAVALLTSSLCHDLDHRGTTNSFQTKSKNTLACLYSSEGSVMERHHFAQALCILNTEGCNIFEDLDTTAYRKILDVMRELILATDLATHIALKTKIANIVDKYDPSLQEHRKLLLSLLMTSADLSDQIKGWRYTRKIADRVYEEFFAQGDMEKAMGSEPLVLMDRNRADIATLQVQFLIDVCMPCYTVLSQFFPPLNECVLEMEDTLKRWRLGKKWFSLPENAHRSALDLLNDPRLESYVYAD